MVFQQYIRLSTKNSLARLLSMKKSKSNSEIHQTTTPVYMQTKIISPESNKSSCASGASQRIHAARKKSAPQAVELVIACVTAEKCGRYVTAQIMTHAAPRCLDRFQLISYVLGRATVCYVRFKFQKRRYQRAMLVSSSNHHCAFLARLLQR